MKVLHVTGDNFRMGSGIYHILVPLVTALRKRQVIADVLTTNKQATPTPGFDSIHPIFYHHFHHTNLSIYDLVVFHGVYDPRFALLAWQCRCKHIPYLVKPHSSLMKTAQKRSGVKKSVVRVLYVDTFIKRSNGIIFSNEEEKENSLDYHMVPKFQEVNGLNLNPLYRPSHSKNNEQIKLVFLSRIDIHHKGLDILLPALREITPFLKQQRVRFDFYGNGSQKDYEIFQSMYKKLAPEVFSLNGPVFGAEKAEVFAGSDIKVLTSRYEGFPTVLTEALFAGLPCVVTSMTNAGFFEKARIGWCSSLASHSIATTIKRAVDDFRNDSREFRLRCQQYATQNFHIEATVGKSIEMYKTIIAEHTKITE